MKSQTMSAAEFRAELKRLGATQSGFAEMTKIPLRTVQSWALGERKIPKTTRALIENIELLPKKDILKAEMLSKIPMMSASQQVAFLKLTTFLADQQKMKKKRQGEIQELRDSVSKLENEVRNLRDTCVFQATKIRTYAGDLERRVDGIEPFNS
jgi:hypothetical protein